MNTNRFAQFTSKLVCAVVAVSLSLGISELIASSMAQSAANTSTFVAAKAHSFHPLRKS